MERDEQYGDYIELSAKEDHCRKGETGFCQKQKNRRAFSQADHFKGQKGVRACGQEICRPAEKQDNFTGQARNRPNTCCDFRTHQTAAAAAERPPARGEVRRYGHGTHAEQIL